MMRRAALCLLACAALLGLVGCEQPIITGGSTRTLTFCVEPAVGPEAIQAAMLFAERVEELSGGKLKVMVTENETAIDAMLESSCDLYLVTNATATEGLGDYLLFGSPFFFQDYNQLTMVLGSDRLVELIGARTRAALRVEPMSALYGGGRVFLHASGTPVATLTDMADQNFGLIASQGGILEGILRTAKVYDSPESLSYDVERRRVQLFDVYKKDLGTLAYPAGLTDAYLIDSFHIADVNWLMIGLRAISEPTDELPDAQPLDDYQLAVLREAAAYALAANDEAVLARERQATEAFAARFGEQSIFTRPNMHEEFEQLLRESNRYTYILGDTYSALRALVK